MTQRYPKGQAPAPKVARPPRLQFAPPPPPVSSGAKPACADCGSTTRNLIRVSPKVLLCASDIRKRKKTKKAKARNARQVRHFGITVEEGDRILELQGGMCICGKWTGYNGASRSLSTDHDHKTGMIRGKLCKHCNDLLGRVKDDPAYFEAMIEYLRNPPAVRALGERYVPEGQ